MFASTRAVRSWRRKGGGVLLALAGMAVQFGCTSQARAPREDWVTQGIRRVSPSSVLGFAEAAAKQEDGDFVLVGLGESMRPHYLAGTAIVVRPTSFFMLQSGMPVVYESRPGRRVAHVLVAKAGAGWRVRGTSNGGEDGVLVTANNLLGVVRYAFVPDEREGRDDRLAGR